MENERIIQTVSNLFGGVDERNWQKVENTLAERVLLDYTSMSGGQPAQLTPTQITDAWAAFLPGFDRTNHQLSQIEVKGQGNAASLHYFGKAEHFIGKEVWIVEGSYDTELIKENGNWLISSHRLNFFKQSGNTGLPAMATERMKNVHLTEQNRKVVDAFFVALETQKFDLLKDVFAENGRQVNPYSPAGFPKSFDGAEGIYQQYSGLTANFGQMRFPRQIFATEDPNFFFVKFRGEIEIKAGGKYENDYLGTFRLENGKVVEYTEYFNQIVMAKAFGIELK
jgi:ketosteroid isomerase-like protein